MHVISYRPTDSSLSKEFLKNSVLKIFIVLFEQNCLGQWSMPWLTDLEHFILDCINNLIFVITQELTKERLVYKRLGVILNLK